MANKRQDKKYGEMYGWYKHGYSLDKIGKMFGMSRQSVYSGFSTRCYELRKKNELPFLVYDGLKFSIRNHGYYARTDGDRCLMHRYVWEKINGKIPEGHDLHHVNHDKSDNRIENLEIYTRSEHAKLFSNGSNQYVKKSI